MHCEHFFTISICITIGVAAVHDANGQGRKPGGDDQLVRDGGADRNGEGCPCIWVLRIKPGANSQAISGCG